MPRGRLAADGHRPSSTLLRSSPAPYWARPTAPGSFAPTRLCAHRDQQRAHLMPLIAATIETKVTVGPPRLPSAAPSTQAWQQPGRSSTVSAMPVRRQVSRVLRGQGRARRRPWTSFDPVRDTNRLFATSSRFRPASPRRAGWPTGLPRADRAESDGVKRSNSRTSRRSSVPGRRRSPARSRELALTA